MKIFNLHSLRIYVYTRGVVHLPNFFLPKCNFTECSFTSQSRIGQKKIWKHFKLLYVTKLSKNKSEHYRFLQYIRLYSKSTKNFTKNRYTMLIIIISHEILRTFLQNILLHHDKFSAYKYLYTIHTYLPLYILNYRYLFKEIDARNYISIIL